MKGDFSRDTFDATKHFLRVLMQQGRVQLDADWNEQVAILLHYLQNLAADIIGPHGGPGSSFAISPNGTRDFKIGKGHYYVDGILCENDAVIAYTEQPDYPLPPGAELDGEFNYLVYLDVWERHITYIEDFKYPFIRETALGGVDTATRTQVIWQVKTEAKVNDCTAIDDKKKIWQPENRGQLIAKGKESSRKDGAPCIISPDATFRGTENQLYRAEIHSRGEANSAMFKWSRDNGSVIFPICELQGNSVTLKHLGLDDSRSLQVGQWVEIIDDDMTKQGKAGPFLQIDTIDQIEKIVTLIVPSNVTPPVYQEDDPRHPLLRRWDGELITVVEGTEDKNWIELEKGIQIQFQPATSGDDHLYRIGDYWLIPARMIIGDVLWPKVKDQGNLKPLALPPDGIEHHYAPLWIISVDSSGNVTVDENKDCRRQITQIPELSDT